jgi:hypothetical protein
MCGTALKDNVRFNYRDFSLDVMLALKVITFRTNTLEILFTGGDAALRNHERSF